jgi:steroid 5-alpha reductase family enzyme
MIVLYLEALVAIALSLAILMALAWGVQQRTGNSGSVDALGALILFTGIPPLEAQKLRSRGQRYRDYQSRTSALFPLPPQNGVVT